LSHGHGHLVIVGLMGSGKTTIGAAVAARLGRPHRDSDADLEARTGRSARDIFASDGVEALHDLELELFLEALAAAHPSVVSPAASIIDRPAGRAALARPNVEVAWLRITATAAASRAGAGAHRPWHEDLADQAERRDPLFAAVADVTLDASDDEAVVVERLLAWVGRGSDRAGDSDDVGPTG
jgi:shikimate kinase